MEACQEKIAGVFLVRSEHLNHHGHLFGGDLMAEIDTIGYCLLRQVFPDQSFVTRAADISFERPAFPGDAIVFEARLARRGSTSVIIEVTGTVAGAVIGTGRMVYVNIDSAGHKTPLNA